jgi:hypothetical protein
VHCTGRPKACLRPIRSAGSDIPVPFPTRFQEVDRLLYVACTMLKNGSPFDPALASKENAAA